MASKLFTFAFLLVLNFSTIAQGDLEGKWTNGRVFYSGGKINDSIWFFSGGDLHEGGMSFRMKKMGGNSFLLAGRNPAYEPGVLDNQPSVGELDDKVEYRVVDGTKVLILRSQTGEIHDLFRMMKRGENLDSIYINSKVRYELAGRYINVQTGKEIVFYPDRQAAEGLTTASDYIFRYEYDFPENLMTFKDGKSFYYVRTKIGLDLFNVKNAGDDEWEKGKKIMSLQRTGWFGLSDHPEVKGRYPFASTNVLTDDILDAFGSDDLKLMRNEIYARHGYVFKAEELKRYFTAQDWYQPTAAAGEDQLSELEKLNVQLILAYSRPH